MFSFSMSAVPMPKLRFLRAEHQQSTSLDLSADHWRASPDRGGFVFVVNPKGANGRTGKEWKKLLPYLKARLGNECNIRESLTSGPSHAIDITREAIREGADAVIAVGGDGTLHEVVNGFFWAGKPVLSHDQPASHSTVLGLIPLGTGSDFARTLGWKNDPFEAIERIAKGLRHRIDVGMISGKSGEPHHFLNVADIHLSAKAGFYASTYKRFGNFCYIFGALRAFIGHENRDLKIKINEGEWEIFPKVTALCIGNAKYFGGGMMITPKADPWSGNFEVVILQNFKWYDFILKLHKLYRGTHMSEENVCSRSSCNGGYSIRKNIKMLRSDLGGEYLSLDFSTFLGEKRNHSSKVLPIYTSIERRCRTQKYAHFGDDVVSYVFYVGSSFLRGRSHDPYYSPH